MTTTTARKSSRKATDYTTHERFIQGVRDIVLAYAGDALSDELAAKIRHAKLLYGLGNGTYRGICHYDAWENGVGKVDVIEIAATAQESWVQLAGTTIHELAHVIAGWDAGHGNDWKDAAVGLGFVKRPAAAGQVYRLAMFPAPIREAVYRLAQTIGDGHPAFSTRGGFFGLVPARPKPCSAGVGVKGGTSRGKGSGSRLRLWECECERPVKVRVASDDFRAHCDECGEPFKRK